MSSAYFTISPEDLHDEQRAGQASLLPVILLSLAILVAHSLGILGILHYSVSLTTFFAAHLLIIAVSGSVVYLAIRSGADSRFALLLLLSATFMGPFGALGTLLAMALHTLYSRRSIPFTEWFASIFPPPKRTLPIVLEEALITGRDAGSRDYEVIPFMDVMRFGPEQAKRAAIMKMSQQFRHDFMPALREGLSDASNAIRVQAATAIARIEHTYTRQGMALETEHRRKPQNPDVMLRLALHYDAYAYSGLLDADRVQRNRRRALEWYHRFLQCQPEDLQARFAMGRLYLRLNDIDHAAACFETIRSMQPLTPAMQSWYLECLYRQQRYSEIRTLVAQHNLTDHTPLWREAA